METLKSKKLFNGVTGFQKRTITGAHNAKEAVVNEVDSPGISSGRKLQEDEHEER